MPLPLRLFCDTSFFYACFDRSDANHPRARTLAAEANASGTTLCATWDVISETVTLLRYRRGFREALAFLTEIRPHLHIVNYGESVRTEAEQIFRQYGGITGFPSATRSRLLLSPRFWITRLAWPLTKTFAPWASH